MKSDLPRYSADGGAARDIFLSDYFSLLFYFEDEGQEYIYEQLLIKIGYEKDYGVICTGGKSKYPAISRENIGSKKIFICDKDYDDITSEAAKYQGPQYVYLGRFCFENYLLEKQALSLLLGEKLKKTTQEIAQSFNLDNYLEILIKNYTPLSKLYAIARKEQLKIQTTKADAKDLAAPSDMYAAPNEEYINTYRQKLIDLAETEGRWYADHENLLQMEANAFTPDERFKDISDNSATTHLCGKHLLRLTILQADKIFKSKLYESDYQDIYCRLISHSKAENFESIKTSIDAAIANL